MGDAQSAQREGKKDAAAEEESGTVDDAQTEQNIEDKPLKNNGQISEINGKGDSSIAEVNGHCEDEIAAEAILSPDEDVSETEKPLKEEETPLENVEINENESPNEADANEDVPLEMIEMDAKQNDINDSFRRFFSNIGLKLTVKRGPGEIPTDVPGETNKEEPNRPEDVEDTAKETKSENAEQNTDVNIAQETYDNDSTTCPTLTDVTSEDILENAEEKATETKEEVESDNADAATTSPVQEDAHQDATSEEPHSTSPSSPEEEVVVSPIKRFFTTGIFSGLQNKKKPAEDETTEKELVDMEKKEVVETTEQTVQDQQQDKEEISPGVEAAAVETEHKENELKEEILSAASAQTTDERKSSTTEPSTIIVTEPEMMSSQEKDKVQASPLKRLLSGSSLKKLSKKQRGRKSSDAKLSDSGKHVSDQLLSSTESAENQKEGPAQPSAAGEEDGAWASFKKLVTPKKRMKRSSLGNEETQIPGSVEEPKPSEGEQISDHSTEEGKKRKDSSVSWEAVLCGSGRRRSRKTSDSEDETPQIDNDDNKQDGGSKHAAELPLETSNEVDEILASSPKQAGSPSEGDGGSTWKSLKKLVTPKRKAKDEDESKDNIQSDNEITQDESSFSMKKLLPGRKKRKSAEKQDQVSSDEADKDVASGDEDSETPAVVPLSEFDTVETEVHIQTQADVESHIPKEVDYELQQDLLDQMAEPVLACDNLQTETKKVQDNDDALEYQASTSPATNEEPDDLTESISKHQQLSDIPEEGIITETMGTPASVTEEAARDDTIADDLIEITSEAITAPEPVDITLADETEMISAVSQLSSESSKTSGNTTPVPAEYDVMETDMLLHQVVETISISPKEVPVCSDELSSERIVGSVSHQILKTFVKEEPTILEIHRRLDATAINTGLNVEELDAINELAATAQTESISEVNDSVSTEIVSGAPTEEFDTAEIVVDEVHEVNVTHPEESVKELERIDESHQLVECLSEVNAAVSTDILPEGEETVADEGSLVEAHQAETEPPKIDSQKADSAATVADETKDGAMEQEVLTLTEKEDHIMHNITDQIQVEDKDQPPVEVEELEELAAVQAATLDPEEGSVQSPEEEVKSEDIPPAETVTDEPKQTAEHLTEVNVEAENKELPVNAVKTEHVQEPEALETVQALTLDSEVVSVQSLEKEVISEDIPEAETVTAEPKEETIPLTEVNLEPVDASKTEHVQEPEVLQAVQAATLDSEAGSLLSLEKEVISVDIPAVETVKDEPKQETEMRVEPEEKLPVEAAKTEHVQEPEVLQAVQAATLDSEAGSLLSLEKEVISVDIPAVETVKDEPKQETEMRVEPEEKLPVEAAKTEHVQEPEVLQAVQAATLDSEAGSLLSLEKEVISVDIPAVETVKDEPKQETEMRVEPEEKLPVEAAKTEHVQEPEVLQAVQAATLDSEAGSLLSLEKEVISVDIPAVETVKDEPKQETEMRVEPEEKLPVEAAKTEHVQEPEVLQAVQAATLDSEAGSLLSLEKEVISVDIPAVETVKDEPKQETEMRVEPEEKLPVEAAKTEHVQEPEVLQAVQAATLDSEAGSLLSLEKEVISVDIPAVETVKDEPKQETEMRVEPEEKLPVEAAKTEHVQEPEVLQAVQAATLDSEAGSLLSLEKEVISVDIPAVETVKDEPKQETEMRVEPEEKLPVEAAKTEHVQEPEVLPSDGKEIVTETKTEEEASMYVHVVTESIEGGSAQELEKQILLEDVPKDADNVIASVTDEIESEDVAQLDQALEITEDQKTESIPQDVQVEQKDRIPEVVDELQTLTAVRVSSVNEEASNVQVLEKTVFTEETPAPCVDNAAVTDEPKHEVHLSAVQVSVEGEKETELPGTEIKIAAVEHAVVAEVVICKLKDVSAAIADVLIEKTSDITEPLIETVASELMFKEAVEAATPLVKDDVAETAEEGSVVVMMHVPSVKFEDNHRIQVQVVDVDIKSGETIVDTVLQVGVTEAKEVIDVCHETVKKVDNLSTTPEIEEELIHEENRVTIQEVIQHVKEILPETVPKSVVVNLEQEVIKQPAVMTEVSEMVASESNEMEDQKAIEDSIGTFRERQDEAHAVISDDSATEQQVSEDLIQTPGIPGSLDVSIHDHKEDLEETKAEQEKSEAGVTAEEVKSSSEELGVKKVNEVQITQIAQSLIVTPSNTGLVVPQNIGIISSIGNVESPSSLSLEFKLNIQFGQVKAPASPPPTTERIEPMKQTDVSEVRVQATEITEPAANLDSTERAVIMTQPVLQDVGIQAMETVEPVEQIKSTERVTSSVQATETIQPVRQTEKREVFLSHPVLSEACDQETKAEEPVKQIEEENDQDVWMDAEEVIYTQEETEVSLLEVEEPLEPQTESEQEEKAGLEHEVEMAPNSKTEEEESQQEMHKAGETCEIESEGEDFAVALEHPEIATASITTMECD